MKRYILLSLLIYSLVFAGLASRNGDILALTLPLVVYLGTALLYRPEAFQLKAVRRLSADQVSQDETIIVNLTLQNEGAALEEILVEDQISDPLTLVEGETSLLASLPSGASIKLSYTLRGGRGAYHFPGVQVRTYDRLGLFKREGKVPATGHFLILPEVVRLRRVEIRPRQTRVYSGLIPARQGGPGVEFFGVREYQPGDPLRWINGRATARHPQSLFINEFEQERMADVGLILDARRQSDARSQAGSLFEYSVQATAALAEAFLNAGNRVGLFIYGRYLDWTFPGYGKLQRQRILQALAKAELGDGQVFETLEHLPTRLFPARSQLVLISPLLQPDAEMLITLRARGYRLLVISPNPIKFEQKGLAKTSEVALAIRIAQIERTLLLGRLKRADIQVVDWQVETPFHQVAHTTLRYSPLWLQAMSNKT